MRRKYKEKRRKNKKEKDREEKEKERKEKNDLLLALVLINKFISISKKEHLI